MKARLISKRSEVEGIKSFVFVPEKPIAYQAGQFLRYVLPHTPTDDRHDDRYFTIVSAPFEEHIQITTRFPASPSSFKRALDELPLGADIQIDEPEGEFVVNDQAANYIFVVGGIGITPVRSILADADHRGVSLNARVLYASRDDSILFQDELNDYASRNSNLQIEYLKDSQHLSSSLARAIEQLNDPYVYVSGPEPMVESLLVTVKKLGIDLAHIQADFFNGYAD